LQRIFTAGEGHLPGQTKTLSVPSTLSRCSLASRPGSRRKRGIEPPKVRAGTVVRALTVLFWMTKTLRIRRP
jgi:hypothetical protein